MRIFAWSDLHLESKVNFELVKQFCYLNKKRPASTENRIISGQGSSNGNEWDIVESGISTDASAGGEAPVWPPLAGALSSNIGQLGGVVTKTSSPVNEDFANDVLILAGDVHHELEGLKDSLNLFCSVFGHVAFVPGNHELWVTRKDRDLGITDSLKKFDSILRLCESLGIHTSPFFPSRKVRLVPLFSWYDEFDPHFRRVALYAHQPQTALPRASQSHPGKTTQGISPDNSRVIGSKLLLSLAENWMDYTACQWPLPLSNNDPKSSGRLRREYSSLGRADPEATLFRRFSGMSLGKSRRCTCRSTNGSGASTAAGVGAAAAVAVGGRETSGLPGGLAWGANASCKPFHRRWSVEEAQNMPNLVLPKSTPRRFTDALGMPLSLSEFFAVENERRGCFLRNRQSPCRGNLRLDKNIQNNKTEPAVSDVPDCACCDGLPRLKVGHTGSSESGISSQATDSEMDVGCPSPEGTCGEETTCFENPTVVITFSHFLPRAELAKLYPLNPGALAYVMGSTRIDEQLRQAEGSLHIFGHSHVNIDHNIEGVRYVQHSLGRPSEQKWFPARLRPKLVFSDGL